MRMRTARWALCLVAVGCGSSSPPGGDTSHPERLSADLLLASPDDDGVEGADVLAVSRVQYDGNTFGNADTYPTIFADPTVSGVQGSIHIDRYRAGPWRPAALHCSSSTESPRASAPSQKERSHARSTVTSLPHVHGLRRSRRRGGGLELVHRQGPTSPETRAPTSADREVARISWDDSVPPDRGDERASSGGQPARRRQQVDAATSSTWPATPTRPSPRTASSGPGTTIGARYGTPGRRRRSSSARTRPRIGPTRRRSNTSRTATSCGIGIFGGNLYVAKGSGGKRRRRRLPGSRRHPVTGYRRAPEIRSTPLFSAPATQDHDHPGPLAVHAVRLLVCRRVHALRRRRGLPEPRRGREPRPRPSRRSREVAADRRHLAAPVHT